MIDGAGVLLAAGIVVAIGIAVLAVGLRLGMLLAPRLTRWAERDADEEAGEPDPQP